jgi:hypothetical protein
MDLLNRTANANKSRHHVINLVWKGIRLARSRLSSIPAIWWTSTVSLAHRLVLRLKSATLTCSIATTGPWLDKKSTTRHCHQSGRKFMTTLTITTISLRTVVKEFAIHLITALKTWRSKIVRSITVTQLALNSRKTVKRNGKMQMVKHRSHPAMSSAEWFSKIQHPPAQSK